MCKTHHNLKNNNKVGNFLNIAKYNYRPFSIIPKVELYRPSDRQESGPRKNNTG